VKYFEKTSEGFIEDELTPRIKYLGYLLKHKANIFPMGNTLDVPLWTMVKHDYTKFKPGIYGPYADFFYGPEGVKSQGGASPEVRAAFNEASMKHRLAEKHHAYRLGQPVGQDTELEMLADWYSVGKSTYKKGDSFPRPKAWLAENISRWDKTLSPETLEYIKERI